MLTVTSDELSWNHEIRVNDKYSTVESRWHNASEVRNYPTPA